MVKVYCQFVVCIGKESIKDLFELSSFMIKSCKKIIKLEKKYTIAMKATLKSC